MMMSVSRTTTIHADESAAPTCGMSYNKRDSMRPCDCAMCSARGSSIWWAKTWRRRSVMALLAIHWLATFAAYSATPLARNDSTRAKGTHHCAWAFLAMRFWSTKGLSRPGNTGSSAAATTIASTDRATTER